MNYAVNCIKHECDYGELRSKLCAGCVIDNLGSPDIGETLPKFC